MARTDYPRKGQKGMTLIELVAVMVLTGVVSGAVVNNHYDATSNAMLFSEAEALRNHLQQAQARAFNTQCNYHWGIRFSLSSNEWQIFTNAPGVTPQLAGEYPDPNTTVPLDTHRMDSEVQFNYVPPGGDIAFNCWGEPVNVSMEILTTDQTVILKNNSGVTVRLNVCARTGRVIKML